PPWLAKYSRKELSQNFCCFFLVDVAYHWQAADARGIRSKCRDVATVDVLASELACARHQLPQSLRDTLIVSVEADRSSRQFGEAVAVFFAQLGRADEYLVHRSSEALDVDRQRTALNGF